MHSGRAERDWLELTADALAAPATAFPERRVAEQLRRTFEARGMGSWWEQASVWGIPAQMALPTYFAADGHRAFVLGRADPFTPGELALLGVLHGLLIGLDRQTAALHSMADPVDIAQTTRLTVREITVLGARRRGADGRRDRPPPGRHRGHGAQAPAEHLPQARGARPARRGAPRPRPGRPPPRDVATVRSAGGRLASAPGNRAGRWTQAAR